jgi:4-amino-4-deoxy-L-arabinose transferase-like glycosyltransferase
VGWLIALMRWLLGDTLWAIRLPVVLLPLALGGALWWGLKAADRQRAAWAITFFWLAPINWLNVLVTTDTPLIFWSVLSVAALLNAERRARLDGKALALYAASGLFIGCAFLSKYFSVVLGLAYLVYFGLFRRDRWAGLLLLTVCALPGPAINIAWNLQHCWTNIMFNLVNRNTGEVFEWRKPAMYVGMMAYMLSPAALWLGWKHRTALQSAARSHRLLACLVLVPLAFFALLSLKKVIGLHWVLSFYPFGFALLAFALPLETLRRCAVGLAAFAALHVAAIAGLSVTSLEQWQGTRLYTGIVRSYRTAQVLEQVKAPGVVLMSNAFTPASLYGFVRREYMPVFGRGNFHSRQDDLLVDFSVYAGKTIRVIVTDKPFMGDYTPYFASTELLTFRQDGATFYAVEGKGFNYAAYKAGVLADINRRYYRIPAWLPAGDCAFCVRFCGKDRCLAD